MKKCNKYSSLIYKELDGSITEEEKNTLTYHIDHCNKCKEEYLFINHINAELKSEEEKELPDNFKSSLHSKLIEYNLNKEEKLPFCKRNYINLTATLCITAAIAIFAFNSLPDIINIKEDENNGHKTFEVADSIEDTNQTQKALLAEPSLNNPVADLNTDDKTAKSVSEPENQEALSDVAIASDVEENISAFTENHQIISDTNKEYITITVKKDTDISSLIPDAQTDNNKTYRIPIENFEKTKEILKDYIVSIENETLKEKDIFLITKDL